MSDITKLEERLAWCEEYIDQLNDALVDVNKRVVELERQNARLIDEVRALQNMSREPFNPRDEKPPHY
ncbi:MAG: SlyX family protein [Thermoguttaceae bacterium]|nr:SlyX family protein [Thermoguttaceae bacterium]